ncbi:MAG TPA: hypothetical protein VM660_01940 [Bacillus sp. (in: firmicutes)]|nr:hypothetical protein [Bacillus sp. (in: firmicutes)]
MNFDLYLTLQRNHIQQHSENRSYLSTDYTCIIYYPPPKEVSLPFKHFWNWISAEFGALVYTGKTVTLFDQYRQHFSELQLIKTLKREAKLLLYSLTFANPFDFGFDFDFIAIRILEESYYSVNFERPVATELQPLVPLSLEPSRRNIMDADQFNAFITQLTASIDQLTQKVQNRPQN